MPLTTSSGVGDDESLPSLLLTFIGLVLTALLMEVVLEVIAGAPDVHLTSRRQELEAVLLAGRLAKDGSPAVLRMVLVMPRRDSRVAVGAEARRIGACVSVRKVTLRGGLMLPASSSAFT
jgi:hypothetical protein